MTVKDDVEMSDEGSDEEESEEEVVEKPVKKAAVSKGKKRAAEEEAVVEKPKKKVKADKVDKKESKFRIDDERVTSLNDVMIMRRARHEHDVYMNASKQES